jgi:hypothetical protein
VYPADRNVLLSLLLKAAENSTGLLMPMTFLFDCNSRIGHSEVMSIILRISLFAITLCVLGALWVIAGPKTAIAAGFAIFSYLFVLAMKSAAEDIRRFECEQRPDLCS